MATYGCSVDKMEKSKHDDKRESGIEQKIKGNGEWVRGGRVESKHIGGMECEEKTKEVERQKCRMGRET